MATHNNLEAKSMDLTYKPYVSVCSMLTVIYGLYFIFIVDNVEGFNVDVSKAIVHIGGPSTMFGYAVAQHNDTEGQWVLIGAPRSKRYNKYISGDVYKCRIDRPRDCRPLGFHQDDDGYQFHSNRTDQWLGATLESSDASGNILTCAPRLYFQKPVSQGNLVGGCHVLTKEGQYSRYDPCVEEFDKLQTRPQKFMCAAGVSAVFNKNGNRVVMGAPGAFAFQGQLVSQNVGRTDIYAETRRVSDPTLSYGYMAMSAAIGKFSDDAYNDYISGAPRVDLIGKVSIYDERLVPLGISFKGEQMGEYFGHSIAVGDFNNDRFDDVAIGAPFYSDYDDYHKYEIGRVYVVYQRTGYDFGEERIILDGPKQPGCRFGYSLENAKDLNDDGYEDLIVGAPYAGENLEGAIFIYYGSHSGLQVDFLQAIYGHNIYRSMVAFGYSISAGKDQDANGFPDMVVGAYESDRVVYLRTRPIISPQVTITSVGKIDIEKDKKCTLTDGTPVSCFNVNTCIEYSGKGVPNQAEFNLMWSLDVHKERNKRAFFWDVANNPTSLASIAIVRKLTPNCVQHVVYLKDNMRDKLSPISIEVTYNMNERSFSELELIPIQDVLVPKQSVTDVHILKYCGPDEICIPNLQVYGKSSLDKLVIGKDMNVDVNIHVQNVGEDSYESRVFTEFPKGIHYINVHTIKAETVITCSSRNNENGSVVICDIGNPLPAQQIVNFTIRASIMTINHGEESLLFNINVNSTNPENTTNIHDNSMAIHLELAAEAKIEITGKSVPEQILYNTTQVKSEMTTITDVGPALTHLYDVRNLGPSNVSIAEVKIFWPSYSEDNSDLLYLVDIPRVLKTDGSCCSGTCVTQFVNLKKLKLPSTNTDTEEVININDSSKRRKKRSSEPSEEKAYEVCLDDSSEFCTLIICQVNGLEKDEGSLIEIKSRVALKTLVEKYSDYDSVVVASSAAASITDFPYNTRNEQFDKDTFQIETPISATNQLAKRGPPIWIIIVAIVVGLVLLVVLMVVLYKLGFFKRKQHEDMKRLTMVGTNDHEETNPMRPDDSEDEF